jgi:hypothetical protein
MWLAEYSWEFVTAQNALLCEAKNALHKATSDGHSATKKLWESRHRDEMSLDEAVELCRRCHRLAPFCFYNGNTFAAIIRDVIHALRLPPARAYVVRSLAVTLSRVWRPATRRRRFGNFAARSSSRPLTFGLPLKRTNNSRTVPRTEPGFTSLLRRRKTPHQSCESKMLPICQAVNDRSSPS